MPRRALALASLIALMVVWGSTFVVTKIAVREVPPLTLAAVRFLIAAAVLLPFALARGGLRALPRPLPLVPLVLMSLSGIALFTIAFNYALVYASASQGALIFALVPAAVAIAAVIALRERPTRRRIAGIVLSICGVVVIVASGEMSDDSAQPLLGAAWMLATVAAWAAYTVYAKRLAAADQIIVIACVSTIGTVMLLPLTIVEVSSHAWQSLSPQGWFGVSFLGVIASAAAYLVYSYVLREFDASLVGAYLNLDPVVGVLTAVLFLGEALNLGQTLGGVVAIAGMWLATDQGPRSAEGH